MSVFLSVRCSARKTPAGLPRLLSSLFLLAALAGPALAADQPAAKASGPIEADRIVALVGDDVITQHELRVRLDSAVSQLKRQGTPLPPQEVLERQMLERMITDLVQTQAAKESGLRIDDTMLDQAISRIAANNKLSVADFRKALEKDGIVYAAFREEIRGEIMISQMREREVDSKIKVSEGEVDNFLAGNDNAAAPEEVDLAHILLRVPEGASPEQIEKLRQKAEQVLARLKRGEDFGQVAAAYSDAPDGLQGGRIGFRSRDRLPALYADAVGNLKPGEISQIMRSANGFHLVKLIDKRGGAAPTQVQQTHARHILLKVSELVSEREAKQKLEGLRERLAHGGDFAELARLYSQDGSASKGGDLGWLYPADTVPEFEKAMDALKIGQISEPVRSPFGWHLIEVQERRVQDMSEERRRLAAKSALRARKADDAYQDWLRQLRDRAYVELRLEDK
jgi:peptidyl-prolyl cis-trans isomerase SurA